MAPRLSFVQPSKSVSSKTTTASTKHRIIYGYDWLILTSTNGVEFFIKRLLARGLKIEDLDEIRVCAIGQRTADKLHDAHVHVDLIPSQSTAEGVFAALSEFAGGEEQLRGLNILLPRA